MMITKELCLSMDFKEYVILGAGIAGLGASYALLTQGKSCVIFEKDDKYGGLCGNFEKEGFRFDRFVHFTFTKNEKVNTIFKKSSPEVYRHIPNAYNLYKGIWIKHPAQNNLYPLEDKEKELIISDFKKRKSVDGVTASNYEEWLRLQFGDYFAEHFPMVYTKKYWMRDAKELRTEWVGQRVYQPSIEEVISGAENPETPITYYAKEMRYPKYGGFKSFLLEMAKNADIRYSKEVKLIDSNEKVITFKDGSKVRYNRLISSLPLPEIVRFMKGDVPQKVREAAEKLECTCGYHISVALRTKNIPPYLWWYIYDKDILASRVHSPSLKSPDNAPDGCSSLQFEVYCKEHEYSENQLIDGTIGKLINLGVINEEDILFVNLGYEKYANVIFTEPIFKVRKMVRDYFSSIGIETIGRFGEWDYLWSDQSLLSGLNLRI